MFWVFFRKPEPWDLPDRQTFLWWLGVWLPAMLAVAMIATESTSTFSSDHTSNWLRPIIEGFVGIFSDDLWFGLHHLIRKSGHFVGYSLVCLAFLRSWLITLGRSDQLSVGRWRQISCLLAILCTAAVAAGDEIHQTFLPSRTGKVSDVILDTTGAVVLCTALWIVSWRRQRQPQPEPGSEPNYS